MTVQRNTQNKVNIQREMDEKNKQATIEEIFNMFQNEKNEENNS